MRAQKIGIIWHFYGALKRFRDTILSQLFIFLSFSSVFAITSKLASDCLMKVLPPVKCQYHRHQQDLFTCKSNNGIGIKFRKRCEEFTNVFRRWRISKEECGFYCTFQEILNLVVQEIYMFFKYAYLLHSLLPSTTLLNSTSNVSEWCWCMVLCNWQCWIFTQYFAMFNTSRSSYMTINSQCSKQGHLILFGLIMVDDLGPLKVKRMIFNLVRDFGLGV